MYILLVLPFVGLTLALPYNLMHICPIDGDSEETEAHFSNPDHLYVQTKEANHFVKAAPNQPPPFHLPTLEELQAQLRDAAAHLHHHSGFHGHSHTHQHFSGHGHAPPPPPFNPQPQNHPYNPQNINLNVHQNQQQQQNHAPFVSPPSNRPWDFPQQAHAPPPSPPWDFQPQNPNFQPPNANFQQQSINFKHAEDEEPESHSPTTPTFDPFGQQTDVMDFLAKHQTHSRLSDHHKSEYNPKSSYQQAVEQIEAEIAALRRQHEAVGSPNLLNVRPNRERWSRNVQKRSIPLAKLLADPRVKLDVPKTFENFGTVTKHAFEDERAPMYHMKHLLGNSRNALLSAMRIPPRNVVIPSDYEIVRANEAFSTKLRRARDPEDAVGGTFDRVGEIIRESIKSGQDTASHLSEMANDARNILHTARHSVPRVILPYRRVAAVKEPRRAVLLAPRILDLNRNRLAKPQPDRLVHLGQLMDAVGISNPAKKTFLVDKITFEPKSTLDSLEDAKVSVGAKSIRDFLVKMRNELTHHEPPVRKYKKMQENKEVGKFIETLFDGSRDANETVGTGMHVAKYLTYPYMQAPTGAEASGYGAPIVLDHETFGDFVEYLRARDANRYEEMRGNGLGEEEGEHRGDVGYVLGAMNPLMFERMYNHTVRAENRAHSSPHEAFGEQDGERVGGSMFTNPEILKPFLGEARPEDIKKYYQHENQPKGDANTK